MRPVRLAVRGILLLDDRLLMVNAWRGSTRVFCAPGGGAEPHQSLPENLRREMLEECGLEVEVGAPCLINEFHDPVGPYHQAEVFFRCRLVAGDPHGDWTDPEGVVTHRRWVTREGLAGLRHRPRSLAAVAWGDAGAPLYDPLEPILR